MTWVPRRPPATGTRSRRTWRSATSWTRSSAPAHPDYTSGHSTFTGAATRLLERWFGTDDIEFTTTSDGLPGAVRTFGKLSDARREVGMSRVYGGIHTMSANLEGQKAGMRVADYVFENALQPLK